MKRKIVEGSPYPLGVTIVNGRINFSVEVPKKKSCELILYKAGSCVPEIVIDMPEEKAFGSVRYLALEEMEPELYEYNYKINGKICIDPYVREVTGHKIFGQKEDLDTHVVRGKILRHTFDWKEDTRLSIPYNEVVAYSLHVRGFTKHSSSHVKHKGTFAGVQEKIPYLQELGINQIHCMPIYEFVEHTGTYRNYWGYGKGLYFAPKAAYASGSNVSDELKEMIYSCHKAGIEVILEMPFEEGVLPQLVVECLRFYIMEYHVDGFIINPYRVSWEMISRDPFLKGSKLIKKEDTFQNTMRRFLKGDEGMVYDVIEAIRHNTKEDGCYNYITGHTGFTLNDLVSYDARHNEANGEQNQDGPRYNYSWNCGVEGPTRKKSILAFRKKQVYNAFFLLLMAQGTPCILAGDEFGNSQKGNNNVYCQDNELSWLDWSKCKNHEELFEYVKKLIAFRKLHKVLHREEKLLGIDKFACGIPDISYHGESAWVTPGDISSRQLGVLYSGTEVGDVDCFIAYNMHWEPHVFALPQLKDHKKWCLILDTTDAIETEVVLEEQKSIELRPRSIALLVGKKAEFILKDRMGEHINQTGEKEKEKVVESKKSDLPFSNDYKA